MNTMQWAWLAGFFDGEGCVNGRIQQRYTQGLKVQVRLSITQKDRLALDHIRHLLGYGVVRLKTRLTGTHEWTVSGRRDVAHFIQGVLPYSIVKKSELAAALELALRLPASPGRPMPDDERQERLRLMDDLHALQAGIVRP